ncbi:glycoside hydrolase, family 3-like protein [Kordia algicida OT-1]|uniref:beta-glucosidase n=1 Tax=Kordia algicida OT-1 TaxID=391587 RepID=A9DI37_9FLAO|nr:glycoside hydrolase, family 3-like protein [Kordia algicida OT-1]
MNSKYHKVFIIASIGIFLLGCVTNKKNGSQMEVVKETSKKTPVDKRVDSLLAKMTLDEKVGQMNLYNGFWDVTGPTPKEGNAKLKYDHLKKGWVGAMLNVRGTKNVYEVQRIAVEETRLGIPLLIGFDVIHGYKTLSPIPLAESSSWDLDAIKSSARVAAIEASSAGINWTFAPMVDISRDPRWGRVMEGGGEDPYLGSKIASARVHGFQGDDLTNQHSIAACAKHFAAYGFAEAGKEYNTVDIGTSTLYNTVLPPFKAAADSGVKTFMNSFNELVFWGHAKDKRQAAMIASRAGSDLDMEGYVYVNELVKLVEDGIVKESIVDDAVRRILKVKFELGLFDDPYKYCDPENEKKNIGNVAHHEAVLDIAKKSIVLLKNEGNLLPLKKEGQKIALIGPLAADKNS